LGGKKFRFYGYRIAVLEDRVWLKKGTWGMIIPLPWVPEKIRVKRGRRKLKIRDLDGIFGGNESEKKEPSNILTISLIRGSEGYLVHIIKTGDHVTIAHGFSHWDGNEFGFIIEGV